ncbi:TonB-dependent receptor [Bacteroides sp. 51]|uniref:SusC/RagA family TonB-linked outer membrane protein n=1 Tax=Bacteroides sp. 51 TaxID=2302938 RepID=UPI0013D675C6|nr:TonB-dependent receptor [Bacteroides sp. 51]NDV80881.1 TonB-dependent receptor [Bacteroides sp. 51]
MRNHIRRLLLLSLFSFCYLLGIAQNTVTVKGTVVDETGEAIIGANVIWKGNTSIGTITNIDGQFTIQVPVGSTLVVSFIGMKPHERKVTATDKALKIALTSDSEQLEEVVVVGYGQQKKASVVGAISQTTGKVLERAGGVSSVGAALTGNLPGVSTMNSTGMPGDEDPEIIIRGASSWNSSSPLILVDGIERPMSSVDISSVQSISVLKDASATAVYGVKGANGVILITTKRGQEGAARVDINFSATAKVPSRLPSKKDSYEALLLRNRIIEHELGLTPESWSDYIPLDILDKYRNPASVEEAERYPNVDWVDELFKNYAMSYNANVNISGGTSFVKYFASVDYLGEGDLFREFNNGRGYQAGFGYNRINGRSNLDFSLTNTTMFKVSLSGSYGVKKTPWDYSDNDYGAWISAYGTPPDAMLPIYSDGSYGYYPRDEVGASNSVYSVALSGAEERTTTRINTDFTLEQDLSKFVKGLSVRGLFSLDNTFLERKRGVNDLYNNAQRKWIDPKTGQVYYKEGTDSNTQFEFQESKKWGTNGGEMDNRATYRRIYYQFQLNWARKFGNHDLGAMGLFSREKYTTGSEIPHYREDWAFRATYNYAQRYFLEVNGAYNGSEKFSSDNRFAFFPSGAVGWMVSEEKFMKPLKFMDMLKLRVSYGKIGDDNVGERWLYMSQWAYGGNAKLGSVADETSPYTWYRPTVMGNTNIHWETSTKLNFGTDFAFLEGLITGSLDVFRNTRTEILVSGTDRAIPSFYGMTAPWANLGKVRATGYELSVKFNKNIGKNWRVWADMNMTHAKDKILERDDAELLPWYQKLEGKPIGQAYSYIDHGYMNTWDDVYSSPQLNTTDSQRLPGDQIIVDYNGDGVIDTNDNVPYGYSGNPQNTYNATVGFDWKGFSFFVQFYGVTNVTRQVVLTSFSGKLNNAYNQGSYWSPDNQNAETSLPRWTSTIDGMSNGTRYMYDGSYIRLKNAEVAYTFAGDKMKKWGVGSLRVYLNGNNLWFWSRMPDDRESNTAGTGWASQGAYPTVRRFNLGFKITL